MNSTSEDFSPKNICCENGRNEETVSSFSSHLYDARIMGASTDNGCLQLLFKGESSFRIVGRYAECFFENKHVYHNGQRRRGVLK